LSSDSSCDSDAYRDICHGNKRSGSAVSAPPPPRILCDVCSRTVTPGGTMFACSPCSHVVCKGCFRSGKRSGETVLVTRRYWMFSTNRSDVGSEDATRSHLHVRADIGDVELSAASASPLLSVSPAASISAAANWYFGCPSSAPDGSTVEGFAPSMARYSRIYYGFSETDNDDEDDDDDDDFTAYRSGNEKFESRTRAFFLTASPPQARSLRLPTELRGKVAPVCVRSLPHCEIVTLLQVSIDRHAYTRTTLRYCLCYIVRSLTLVPMPASKPQPTWQRHRRHKVVTRSLSMKHFVHEWGSVVMPAWLGRLRNTYDHLDGYVVTTHRHANLKAAQPQVGTCRCI
jgi:hypothetical protein